ncbi:MAG: type II toxin-antitoxin system PemK/MazF family toxin [Rhodospirillales bacterium]
MIYDRFDIVVVPFPFTDHPLSKRRPALVVSTEQFCRQHRHLILCMITAATRSHWPSNVEITQSGAAGLRAPCVIRLKLFTLEISLILRTLGRLAPADAAAATRALALNLGLPAP